MQTPKSQNCAARVALLQTWFSRLAALGGVVVLSFTMSVGVRSLLAALEGGSATTFFLAAWGQAQYLLFAMRLFALIGGFCVFTVVLSEGFGQLQLFRQLQLFWQFSARFGADLARDGLSSVNNSPAVGVKPTLAQQGQPSPLSSDVDAAVSTDFEDLAVFALDLLELLWQDLNLLTDVCGNNLAEVGLALSGLTVRFGWRRVLANRRLKK